MKYIGTNRNITGTKKVLGHPLSRYKVAKLYKNAINKYLFRSIGYVF